MALVIPTMRGKAFQKQQLLCGRQRFKKCAAVDGLVERFVVNSCQVLRFAFLLSAT